MHRDFKIGLAIGMVLVAGAAVWLCTLPRMSAEARALQSASTRQTNVIETPQAEEEIQTQNPPALEPQRTSPDFVGEQPVRIHVVEKGQTLSAIAEKYYGTGRNWQKILNANRTTLRDPNKLTPGARLIIPE